MPRALTPFAGCSLKRVEELEDELLLFAREECFFFSRQIFDNKKPPSTMRGILNCAFLTAYQKDEETGLDFAEARMYQNLHGRFTAIDPLLTSGKSGNPQTFNRYVYVMNSPLVLTDPSGLQAGAFPEFKFSVYVRAFAPFKTFGPGNIATGDNRSFSTDPNASYRIQVASEVTAANDGR